MIFLFNLHLHPLSYVVKVVQIEDGVFQSGYGTVGVQQTTHMEFVAVALVPGARCPSDQWQRFPLELTGEHGGGGAGTRLRLLCHGYRKRE